MVRKGGSSRVSSKRPTTTATVVGPTLPPIGQPALTYGGSGGPNAGGSSHHHNHHLENGLVSGPGKNAVVVLASSAAAAAADDDHCPQCGLLFNTSKYRKVTDSCGHVKCRNCIIMSEEGCLQCGGGSSPSSGTESGTFIQCHPHQNSRKGPTIVDVTGSLGSVGSHHLTRRAAAAHRLQSATNSRTNSINSARPTSSSPSSSASNDTGRQSSSVYSDSADSDSCLRFPSSIAGGVENDGYPATIDFEAMAELTSPNLDTGFMSISEYNSTDNKSYTSIINEDSEFSKSLMSLRKLHEPSIHNNNNSTNSSSASTTLGTTGHGGLITRAQLKEMPNLAPQSAGTSHAASSSPPTLNKVSGGTSTLSRRRCRDSPQVDEGKGNSKIASGGGSPDITQGVPREAASQNPTSSPTAKANSSGGAEENNESGNSSTGTTSRLSALLTRSSSKINKGNSSDAPSDTLPTPSATAETPESHSNSVAETSQPSSSPRKGRNCVVQPDYAEDRVKEEEFSLHDNGSGEDSKGGDDDEDDDTRLDDGDGGEGGDDPVPKKKKKRSPVVIHDHITVLGGEPPMYQCNVCQKKFKTKAHIKYHEFCQKGDKPFKCEQCGQGFIAKSHYEYHLRTHTGERPYVCPKCGKGFNQRGKVTRHMRSHTGEKPFVCQECNRGFANAQALRSHTLIHTGERPFACTYCNKRFTGMTNLKKHVITHTGERPFTCNHCGKSFGLKWTLDLHLRTHSSERPYACDQCSRAFSNSKDLRRHLVIHSGERPFKCWICGTAFRRKDNLDRHIKNTHNQPKEVAKKLANEAAAEYLKLTTKNQSLGNIPVSKVNSVVISNIIKNADLMPAGGIVPNNLHNKSKLSCGPSNQSNANVKGGAKGSSSTGGSGGSGNTPSTSSPSTTTPSSVQQSSPSARRRVIITAPLSPPTTRASRSKETDSTKTQQQRKSAASLSPSTKKGKSAKQSEVAKGKGAASAPQTQIKKEKVLPPPPAIPKEESVAPKVEVKEKRRKSKKKKAKKSKRKTQERVPPPPSPPITVEFVSSRKGSSRRKSKDVESKEEVEEKEAEATDVVEVQREQRLQPLVFCDDFDQRRPTLTLVTPQSPMKEESEESSINMSQRLSTPPPQPPPPVTESKSTQETLALQELEIDEHDDDKVECILPHDIDQVDETDLLDTLAETSPSREKESDDLMEMFQDQTSRDVEKIIQKSEDLSPLPSQPPAQLLEVDDEEKETESSAAPADYDMGTLVDSYVATSLQPPTSPEVKAPNTEDPLANSNSSEPEKALTIDDASTSLSVNDETNKDVEEPVASSKSPLLPNDEAEVSENVTASSPEDKVLPEPTAILAVTQNEDDNDNTLEKPLDMPEGEVEKMDVHEEQAETQDTTVVNEGQVEKDQDDEVQRLVGQDFADDNKEDKVDIDSNEVLSVDAKVNEPEKTEEPVDTTMHSAAGPAEKDDYEEGELVDVSDDEDMFENEVPGVDETAEASEIPQPQEQSGDKVSEGDLLSEHEDADILDVHEQPTLDQESNDKVVVPKERAEDDGKDKLVVSQDVDKVEEDDEDEDRLYVDEPCGSRIEASVPVVPSEMDGKVEEPIVEKDDPLSMNDDNDASKSCASPEGEVKVYETEPKAISDDLQSESETSISPSSPANSKSTSESSLASKVDEKPETQPKTEKMLPTLPAKSNEESDVPKVEIEEKRRKSKTKKAKKSKSKRQEHVSPSTPQIEPEVISSRKRSSRRKCKDGESKKEDDKEEMEMIEFEKEQRLEPIIICDVFDRRRPTLTLVTSQSPKKEESEESSTNMSQLLSTPPPQPPSPVTESKSAQDTLSLQALQVADKQNDDKVESILPNDTDKMDETDLMDTLAENSPSREQESDDLMEIFPEQTSRVIGNNIQKSDDFFPLPSQPPAQLLEEDDEEKDSAPPSVAAADCKMGTLVDSYVAASLQPPPSPEVKAPNAEDALADSNSSEPENARVVEDATTSLSINDEKNKDEEELVASSKSPLLPSDEAEVPENVTASSPADKVPPEPTAIPAVTQDEDGTDNEKPFEEPLDMPEGEEEKMDIHEEHVDSPAKSVISEGQVEEDEEERLKGHELTEDKKEDIASDEVLSVEAKANEPEKAEEPVDTTMQCAANQVEDEEYEEGELVDVSEDEDIFENEVTEIKESPASSEIPPPQEQFDGQSGDKASSIHGDVLAEDEVDDDKLGVHENQDETSSDKVLIQEEHTEDEDKLVVSQELDEAEEDDDDEDRLYVDESYGSPAGESAPVVLTDMDDKEEEPTIESNDIVSINDTSDASKADASPKSQVEVDEAESRKVSEDDICQKPLVEAQSESKTSISPSSKPASPVNSKPTPDSSSASKDDEKPDASLPPEISDFVLSVLDPKSNESLDKMDDLESISSESLASPQSDVENSIKMCIRTLESDSEEDNTTQKREEPSCNLELNMTSPLQVPANSTPSSSCLSSSFSPPTSSSNLPTSVSKAQKMTPITSTPPSLSSVIPRQKPESVTRLTFPSLSSQLIKLTPVVPPTVSVVNKVKVPSVVEITSLRGIPNPLIKSQPKPQPPSIPSIPKECESSVLVPERSSPPMVPQEEISPAPPSPPPKSTPVSKSNNISLNSSPKLVLVGALDHDSDSQRSSSPAECLPKETKETIATIENVNIAPSLSFANAALPTSDNSQAKAAISLSSTTLTLPSCSQLQTASKHDDSVNKPNSDLSLNIKSITLAPKPATPTPTISQDLLASGETTTTTPPPPPTRVQPTPSQELLASREEATTTPFQNFAIISTTSEPSSSSSSPPSSSSSSFCYQKELPTPRLTLVDHSTSTPKVTPLESRVPTLTVVEPSSSKEISLQATEVSLPAISSLIPPATTSPSTLASDYSLPAVTEVFTRSFPAFGVNSRTSSPTDTSTSLPSPLVTPKIAIADPSAPAPADVTSLVAEESDMEINKIAPETLAKLPPGIHLQENVHRNINITPIPNTRWSRVEVRQAKGIRVFRKREPKTQQQQSEAKRPKLEDEVRGPSEDTSGTSNLTDLVPYTPRSTADSSREITPFAPHPDTLIMLANIALPDSVPEPTRQVTSVPAITASSTPQININHRANGMVASTAATSTCPLTGKNVAYARHQQISSSVVTVTPTADANTKEPYSEPKRTKRVRFVLPPSTAPVSTVAGVQTPSMPVNNATSQPKTTPMVCDPGLVYFMQPEGQPAGLAGDYQLVYAAAAATTEREEGVVDGPPNKVRLLYAEALGVDRNSLNENELQFYYAATTPDQQVQHHVSEPSHVQLMEPYRVSYSQTSNDARSEQIQYHVQHPQQPQYQQQSPQQPQYQQQNPQHQTHQTVHQQQQVLNLSVNNNPMNYYNYGSASAVTATPPPPPHHSGQHHTAYSNDTGHYSSASTAEPVGAHQSAYTGIESQPRYSYQSNNGSMGGQGVPGQHYLDLPIHNTTRNRINYAHVQPQQHNLLEKAREVQHAFPQGAFRYCDPNTDVNYTNQNLQNGAQTGYAKNGATVNGDHGSASSFGGRSDFNTAPGSQKMTGLDLLSAATEKIKSMRLIGRVTSTSSSQTAPYISVTPPSRYGSSSTARAAAAIAAVGEIARLQRLENHNNQQQQAPMQQPPPVQQHQQQPSSQEHPPPYNHMTPQTRRPPVDVVPPAAPQNQVGIHGQGGRHFPQPNNNVQLYVPHPNQPTNSLPDNIVPNPVHQQAGIRRGPRKYYLSRSAQYQD